jgi:hypothetical protein
VKYFGMFWAFLFFVGMPISYTLQLFYDFEPPHKGTTILFIVVIFITSFWNVFKRNHNFMVFPQILKMLLAVYATIFGFASMYKYAGLLHGADEITHQSIDALYFSIVTWTTLGYGDLQPTESIKLLAALEAMLGTLFIPLLLAAIIFALQSNQSHNQALNRTP